MKNTEYEVNLPFLHGGRKYDSDNRINGDKVFCLFDPGQQLRLWSIATQETEDVSLLDIEAGNRYME